MASKPIAVHNIIIVSRYYVYILVEQLITANGKKRRVNLYGKNTLLRHVEQEWRNKKFKSELNWVSERKKKILKNLREVILIS